MALKQAENTNTQAAFIAAAEKKMEPIVNVVSTSRTPSEITNKLKSIDCKNIITEPPGFLKEPETINFRKDTASYEIAVDGNKATVSDLGAGVSKEVVMGTKTEQMPKKKISFEDASETSSKVKVSDLGAGVSKEVVMGTKPTGTESKIPPTVSSRTRDDQVASQTNEKKVEQLNADIANKFQSNKMSDGRQVRATVENATTTVYVPIEGNKTLKIIQPPKGQTKASIIDDNGNEEKLSNRRANAILNQNGYNINLEDFQKWLQQQLKTMLGGSAGAQATTEDRVTSTLQQMAQNDYQNKTQALVNDREEDAVKKC